MGRGSAAEDAQSLRDDHQATNAAAPIINRRFIAAVSPAKHGYLFSPGKGGLIRLVTANGGYDDG